MSESPDRHEQRLIHPPATGSERDAALLSRYGGWYGHLTSLGAGLPARTDGRSWRVHVTAIPVGYLGEFRLSRVTGRWFSGRHRWHELGWAA